MATTTTQKTTTTTTTKNDYLSGEFDAAIALPPQSQKSDYLNGYYNGKNVPF
jgi:hypothetical protein